MKLPVRKCYHATKVCFFLILVVTVLSLFEHWRGGKRSAKAQYLNPDEEEYERQILEDEARIIPGLGEGGVAAHLLGEDKRLGEESEKKLAINVYLSDRIAYNRSLKDYRNPACERVTYDAELPSVSVILIFHNEPYSVVVRTIWSVLDSARRSQPWYKRANYVDRETGRTMTLGYSGQDPNSPFVYLKEIILVDDNSTLPELKGKLSYYVRTRLPADLIRILRLPDRQGLTRARLAGSKKASAEVLVFLDSHCEAQKDWLRPLLQRIKDSPTTVVTPVIDMIETDTFRYQAGAVDDFEGLMRARLRGARAARGEVLVFLDAHCEGGSDWLRPLLQRLRHKRDAVLTPLIDVIDQSTFQLDGAEHFQVGGFTFMGHFTWIDVPEREKKRRGSDIAPTWSPTMAGGLFAIGRAYFWEVGAYDEQMAGWGGENLEMSFRIWQCGGTLETVPCSRVGHVFRSFHPYGLPAKSDTHGINTARMAEVWMDEYAELFYLHRPDLRKNPKIGDVTHRRVLREKLQCKPFRWYLDTVYRDKFVPVRDVQAYGRFLNPASGLCLDTLQRDSEAAPLGVYPCHGQLQATQYLALSLAGELRDEERCADLHYTRRNPIDVEEGRRVLMVTCHGKQRGQKWRYLATKQLQHAESGLCLRVGPAAGADVTAAVCDADSALQRWQIDYTEENGFRLDSAVQPSEQELRLQKLRGQRRISRSLLSYDNSTRRHTHTHSHKKHKHKRAHRKNKFILKLVRSAPGGAAGTRGAPGAPGAPATGGARGAEEHLEVDIHCPHTQLFPNNSFVRDIVTILNDKDIKVINNGRVFEKHRVSLLSGHQPDRLLLPPGPPAPPETLAPPEPPVPPAPPAFQAPTEMAPEYADLPRPKFLKHKKRKHAPDSNPPPSPPAPPSPPSPARDADNIIVEDFVELKPVHTDRPVRVKKRKRVREQHPEQARPVYTPIRPVNVLEESAEGAAMASGEVHWPEEISRFRRNNSSSRAHTQPLVRAHTLTRAHHNLAPERAPSASSSSGEGVEGVGGVGGAAPVKVLMRSNLTFKLADDFFRWQRHGANDVANVLGSLVIPQRTSGEKRTGSSRSKELEKTAGKSREVGRSEEKHKEVGRSDEQQSGEKVEEEFGSSSSEE